MSEYPIVIVGTDLITTQNICREFVKSNPINSIERKGQAKWKIISNGKEYWIMHENCYEEWRKGRTYLLDGQKMHSGYPIK